MAAINVQPLYTTTSTAAGTTTINHNGTVPAGKRWLVDVIVAKYGVADSNNDLDIQFDQNGSGTFVNIWPQEDNFKNKQFDMASRYPRAIEMEETDVLRLQFTRGTSATVDSELYILESDI